MDKIVLFFKIFENFQTFIGYENSVCQKTLLGRFAATTRRHKEICFFVPSCRCGVNSVNRLSNEFPAFIHVFCQHNMMNIIDGVLREHDKISVFPFFQRPVRLIDSKKHCGVFGCRG